MKKILFMLLAVLSMAACGDSTTDPFPPEQPRPPEQSDDSEESDDNPDMPEFSGNGRYLVLYCSRTSNTQRVAQQIQTRLDCDILEVEPQTPYDTNYNAMLNRAQEELAAIRQGIYPAINTSVENFDDYDIVFIGYPIWHGSMATPMQTFLHTHASKLAGKRVALFATSGSSDILSSVSEAQTLCSGADLIGQTLLLTSSTISLMESRVTAWLGELGAIRGEADEIPTTSSLKVNITAGNRTFTASMENNTAGRDFFSRLPLEVTLNDYHSMEKIFYPDPRLATDGVIPMSGDITVNQSVI